MEKPLSFISDDCCVGHWTGQLDRQTHGSMTRRAAARPSHRPNMPSASPAPPAPPAKPRGADPATKKKNDKKKKRKNPPGGGTSSDGPPPAKQRKTAHSKVLQCPDAVKHALLAQYYPTTLTLRQYVLDSLPASSRLRRRKIAAVGTDHAAAAEDAQQQQLPDPGLRAQLATLLDSTLVGLHVPPRDVARPPSDHRLQQWIDYSQRDDSHVTLSGGDASAVHFQSEVGFIQGLRGSRPCDRRPGDRRHGSAQG